MKLCKAHRLAIGILICLMVQLSFAEQRQADPTPPVTGEKKNNTGAVIAVCGITLAVAGVGGFFLVRHAKRQRRHADSIIAIVENAWDSAQVLYATEQYRPAIRKLQSITEYWYEYERFSNKYRKHRRVHPDSIRTVIASSDFLERMIPPIRKLSRYAERLPTDEYGLSRVSRHRLIATKQFLRNTMDSILAVHINHRNGLQYSFRHINNRIRQVDSLEKICYSQHKKDFTLKNKFYYNRAIEANSTRKIRDFVDDCDYYQVDKEWCQRARMALQGKETESAVDRKPTRNMSVTDSITFYFERAVHSNQIELLESYIKKYSSRRYRSKRRYTKLDSAKAALQLLQLKVKEQVAFNNAHPRFGNIQPDNIPLTVKGLSRSNETAFRHVWTLLYDDLTKLPAVRLPASLLIDYTSQPPALTFDAVIAPHLDIKRGVINSRTSYTITCLFPVMDLLHRFKMLTIARLAENKSRRSEPEELIDYQIKKIEGAVYMLRLSKPDNNGTLLFYAKGNSESDADTGAIQFYNFYDFSASDQKNSRFPIYSGSLPHVIPSLNSDSLEMELGNRFFEE